MRRSRGQPRRFGVAVALRAFVTTTDRTCATRRRRSRAVDTRKLTVTHEIDRQDAKLIHAVSGGWPKVLSNLKSLLETGKIAFTQAKSCA